MDFNLLVGSLQLALAAFQLKLDHFKKPRRNEGNQVNDFYDLGEAIRALEYALAETVSFIGQTNNRQPNPRLATLWEEASRAIRKIRESANLADITFEKNLYWRNPEFYRGQGQTKLYRISLDNVLVQLRQLRSNYDKLQAKIDR